LNIVCIPAYNEESYIANIVKSAKNHVDQVIVCDDGSSDNTAKLAREAGTIVITHDKNQGYGAAISTLFDDALKQTVEWYLQNKSWWYDTCNSQIISCNMVLF